MCAYSRSRDFFLTMYYINSMHAALCDHSYLYTHQEPNSPPPAPILKHPTVVAHSDEREWAGDEARRLWWRRRALTPEYYVRKEVASYA
jgi:hypothetical protein